MTTFWSISCKSGAMYIDGTNVSEELTTSICRVNKYIFPLRDYQNHME